MKIKIENPPNNIRVHCERAFDLSGIVPVFTYGDTIYNPFNAEIDPFLMAHESAHYHQQGEDPKLWWSKYLGDKKFRFKQELQAYRVQYRVMKDFIKDRNKLFKLLYNISRDLSDPMYGNLCSCQEAMDLIKK